MPVRKSERIGRSSARPAECPRSPARPRDVLSREPAASGSTCGAATAVGSHVHTTSAMILLVRGELVRRYPSVMISAVPAVWNADNSRSPSADASTMVLPAFRGRIGEDVLYAGFPRPSLLDAVGTPTRAGAAGWFVLLTENPGDPRFGVDPEGGNDTADAGDAQLGSTASRHEQELRDAAVVSRRARCAIHRIDSHRGDAGEPGPPASVPGIPPRVAAGASEVLTNGDDRPYAHRARSGETRRGGSGVRCGAARTGGRGRSPHANAGRSGRRRPRACRDSGAGDLARDARRRPPIARHRSRLDQLQVFTTGDQLLGSIAGNQVLGLFPVGVEAEARSRV